MSKLIQEYETYDFSDFASEIVVGARWTGLRRGQRRLARLYEFDMKAIVTQTTIPYNRSCNTQHLKPYSRRATRAENNIRVHSWQQRTENGWLKNIKTLPDLFPFFNCTALVQSTIYLSAWSQILDVQKRALLWHISSLK